MQKGEDFLKQRKEQHFRHYLGTSESGQSQPSTSSVIALSTLAARSTSVQIDTCRLLPAWPCCTRSALPSSEAALQPGGHGLESEIA